MTSPHIHTLTGAYALDALDDVERRAFEHHLAACPDCAREVDELRATAAVLATSVAQPPPQQLRERVLREVAHTRQDPPGRPRPTRAAGRWRLRLTSSAAVLAVLAALGLGVVAVHTNQELGAVRDQLGQLQQHDTPLTRVLSAPDAHVSTAAVTGGGTATVVASRRLDQAVLLVAGMPGPPARHVYQAWLLGTDRPRSAGLLAGVPLLIDPLTGAAQIGITIEPDGGSPQPTTAPILAVSLPT